MYENIDRSTFSMSASFDSPINPFAAPGEFGADLFEGGSEREVERVLGHEITMGRARDSVIRVEGLHFPFLI